MRRVSSTWLVTRVGDREEVTLHLRGLLPGVLPGTSACGDPTYRAVPAVPPQEVDACVRTSEAREPGVPDVEAPGAVLHVKALSV